MDSREIERIINISLAEDIGRGDITSVSVIPPEAEASLSFVSRESCVACGLPFIGHFIEKFSPRPSLTLFARDGDSIAPGTKLLTISGNARAVLAVERASLNLIQHLSGIATLTSRFTEEISGTKAKILDTRKTLPGLREIQKYAVRVGGGHNHRFRLDDGVLIKDNHIAICGGITEAVNRARATTPALIKIEVECDTVEQAREAIAAGADVIMADNMSLANLAEVVKISGGKVPIEASGGISLDNVRQVAETGVDYISVGKLTLSAPSIDIGADFERR